ncbi:hypothetical protein QYF36_016679 [Acer negundo]|nr:hypothetical protein QYF36_016679 [Acer negundo]
MRQILLKLKHNAPNHLNPDPAAPALSKDTKTCDVAAPSKAAVDANPTEVVVAACLLLDEFSVSLTCDYRLNITEIDYISYYDKGEIECSELSYLFAS